MRAGSEGQRILLGMSHRRESLSVEPENAGRRANRDGSEAQLNVRFPGMPHLLPELFVPPAELDPLPPVPPLF
jgi:hypothetical protein